MELSGDMLAQSRVIAKGRRIRDLNRLIRMYGGRPSRWTKKSGPPFEIDGLSHEYHWYEHPDVGRVEIKIKRIKEP